MLPLNVNGFAITQDKPDYNSIYRGLLNENELISDYYAMSKPIPTEVRNIIDSNIKHSMDYRLTWINYRDINELKIVGQLCDQLYGKQNILAIQSTYLQPYVIIDANALEIQWIGYDIVVIGYWSLLQEYNKIYFKDFKINEYGLLQNIKEASSYINQYHLLAKNGIVEEYEDVLGSTYCDIIKIGLVQT